MFTKNHIELMKNYTFDASGRIFDATGKEVTDELDLIALRAANLIYKDTMNEVNKGADYEKALENNLSIINRLRYDKSSTRTDLLSQILNGSNHVEREFVAESSTIEELQEKIAKSDSPVALLAPENIENTKALINLKLLDQNLILDSFNVNYTYLGQNKWLISADYKIKDYKKENNMEQNENLDSFNIEADITVNDINTLEELRNELEKAEQALKEARERNDEKAITYYQERIELLNTREIDLMVQISNSEAQVMSEDEMSIEELEERLKKIETQLEKARKNNDGFYVVEYYEEQIKKLRDQIELQQAKNKASEPKKEAVEKPIEEYKEVFSEHPVNEITSIKDIEEELEVLYQHAPDIQEVRDRVYALFVRKEELMIEPFLQSPESQNKEKVEDYIKRIEKAFPDELIKNESLEKIIAKLEARLLELQKKENELNELMAMELYIDEPPVLDGLFTIEEFYNYLRDYKYEDETVYERKNNEIVTDEEIILKMKAITLVDTLARQEIKEKVKGYDPVTLPESIIMHYLRIFSFEKVENNEMNNVINEILNSNGHFEYMADALVRTDKNLEEDIKDFCKKYSQSALKLFLAPLRDCTEAIITFLQKKKGIIVENINILFEEMEGKIKLNVDSYFKKPKAKIEPNPSMDVLTVQEVRYFVNYYGIGGPENFDLVYSFENNAIIMDKDLNLKVRMAHLIYNYANHGTEVTDEAIQAAIADFSMYGKDENGNMSKVTTYLLYLMSNLDLTKSEGEIEKEYPLYPEIDTDKDIRMFNTENIGNTKALLKFLFKKMGLELENFEANVLEEYGNKKLVFNYKFTDPSKKNTKNEDKVRQIKLFDIEGIKYYASTYRINKQGQLVFRDTDELVTDEETIVQACSAKFISNIALDLKEKDISYALNSFDENLDIVYEAVLDNYVINDILNNPHLEYTKNKNDTDEDLKFVFNKKNARLLKFYIRDQFRFHGYDVKDFKMKQEEVELDKIRYSIDYKIINLEQKIENEEVLEDGREDQNLTNFTPTIAINILTNFIDEALENDYKNSRLNEKKTLLNVKMRNADLNEQYRLQIRQKAIDLIECFKQIKTLSDIYERGLATNSDVDINYAFTHLEELKEKIDSLNLSEDETLLLNEIQQKAFYDLIANMEEIFINYQIGIQENNDYNDGYDQGILDNLSQDDSHASEYNPLDGIASILTQINNGTLTYGDLNYYYEVIINLMSETDAHELYDLTEDLEMIKFNLEILIKECSNFGYVDQYNKIRNVFYGGNLYINDFLTNPKGYKVKKNVNSEEEIRKIKELLLTLKNQIENLNISDIAKNKLESSNEFELVIGELLMKCQKKEVTIGDIIQAITDVSELQSKARKGKCNDLEETLYKIKSKLNEIYKTLKKLYYLKEITKGSKQNTRFQNVLDFESLKIEDVINNGNQNVIISGINLEKTIKKLNEFSNELFSQLYDFQIDNDEIMKINLMNGNKKGIMNFLKTDIFHNVEDNSFKL